MTEIFDKLDIVAEADEVVYLAGLQERHDVPVTTLESGIDTMPALEGVTEWLPREEQEWKGKETAKDGARYDLSNQGHPRRKLLTCHF